MNNDSVDVCCDDIIYYSTVRSRLHQHHQRREYHHIQWKKHRSVVALLVSMLLLRCTVTSPAISPLAALLMQRQHKQLSMNVCVHLVYAYTTSAYVSFYASVTSAFLLPRTKRKEGGSLSTKALISWLQQLSWGENYRKNWSHQPGLIIKRSAATTTKHQQRALFDNPEMSDQQHDYFASSSVLIEMGRKTFQSKFRFQLDDWQLHAGGAIVNGSHVIVCSPTGSGKTVVAEMALHYSYNGGCNRIVNSHVQGGLSTTDMTTTSTGIYTTPLKALSNEKYTDLVTTFGRDNVGLSTGDVSINKINGKRAPITVMTTEVYRNIAWRSSRSSSGHSFSNAGIDNTDVLDELSNNVVVVLDEFHYMGHPGRGGVWEEAVVTSPNHTQIIALSATLSNGPAIRDWIQSITHRSTVLIQVPDKMRPVPLRYLYGTKDGLLPLFRDPDAGPGAPNGLLGYDRQQQQRKHFSFDNHEDPDDESDDPVDYLQSTEKHSNMKIKRNKNGSSRYKRGFEEDDDDLRTTNKGYKNKKYNKLPRGLQVNPALRKAAEQRLQRVLRELDKQRYGGSSKLPIKGRRSSLPWDDLNFEDLDDVKRGRGKTNKNRASSRNSGTISPKQELKERERLLKKELRRSVPTLHSVMLRLQQKQLLPAIFFIFSRNGCDQAAESVCRYMLGPKRFPGVSNDDDDSSNDDNKDDFKCDANPDKTIRKNGRISDAYADKVTNKNSAAYQLKSLAQDKKGRMFRLNNNYIPNDALLRSSTYEASKQQLLRDTQKSGSKDEYYDGTGPLSVLNWGFYTKVGLLKEFARVEEVASRLVQFNRANEEIAFTDASIERFLLGVASHHAGMLPAHKSFIEVLFRAQLIKVVFATETLAAGINMPARTTVVCALAKPGGNSGSTTASLNLLETHNLLQMAGRAGRRGMDTDGTCVILATPFENEEVAAKILIDPIKPITSQFSPSYTLCVNLIDRGAGKLDVAQQLVSKSFAMWQRRQIVRDQDSVNGTRLNVNLGDNAAYDQIDQTSAQANCMQLIIDTMQSLVLLRSATFDATRIETILDDAFNNRESLKATSKLFLSLSKRVELEQATLTYLLREHQELKEFDSVCSSDNKKESTLSENERNLKEQIEIQELRVQMTEREMQNHPFPSIASVISDLMTLATDDDINDNTDKTYIHQKLLLLRNTLSLARGQSTHIERNDSSFSTYVKDSLITADELSLFAKSYVVVARKTKKALRNPSDNSTSRNAEGMVFTEGQQSASTVNRPTEGLQDSWNDFVSITRTLIAFGCVTSTSNNVFDSNATFSVTPAGLNVGMIGLENSLWSLVALGGAWDISGATSKLDDLDIAFEELDLDGCNGTPSNHHGQRALDHGANRKHQPHEEAQELVFLLRSMSPGEIAGYVSSIISEDSRNFGTGGLSVVEQFQQLTPLQQRVTQSALRAMERLEEVQIQCYVDDSTRSCNLDMSTSQVVTAWANGCSWNEALQMTGLPPGDLVRILSRTLDALRQFGNLPYIPLRRKEYENPSNTEIPRGIHPDIRQLCREAAKAINRYPVKDQLFLEDIDDPLDALSDDVVTDEV